MNQQKKIDLMVDYVFTNDCRFKYILKYFGENVDDYSCNKCDNCVEDRNISSESTRIFKGNNIKNSLRYRTGFRFYFDQHSERLCKAG